MKTLYLSGVFGYHFTVDTVNRFLRTANNEPIIVMIDSPGGSVFDGFSVVNAINDYPGVKVVVLGAIAASMAAYAAVAINAEHVYMRDNTVFMYHNPWGGVIGDYVEFQKAASFFEQLTDIIAISIAKKTGSDKEFVKKNMSDTTWLIADQLTEGKFVESALPEAVQKQIEPPPEKVKSYDFIDGWDVAAVQVVVKNELKSVDSFADSTATYEIIAKMSKLFSEPKVMLGATENNPLEGVEKVTYEEFIKQNPSAKSEILQSEEVKAALAARTDNIKQILALSGYTLDVEVMDAVTRGLSPAEYALNVLARERKKQKESATGANVALNINQGTNFDTVGGAALEAASNADAKATSLDKALDKVFAKETGGK